MEQATRQVIIHASPARCFEVATDFEAYPDWSADIKKVDFSEHDDQGRGLLVHFWAQALGRSTEFTLGYRYAAAPERLAWQLARGDIERHLDGEYVFEPLDGGTRLTLNLGIDLRVPMPGFVRRRAEGRILGTALQELKTRAEDN